MSMRFTFTLDDHDLRYFQRLLRDAKKYAKDRDPDEIVAAVRALVKRVHAAKRMPRFAEDAVDTLETLMAMIEDEDWALPKATSERVLASLAYFAAPDDLIPDHVPGLGFLDDAIMVKIVEGEFEPELWGYRKFCKFRKGAEQRPWTDVAKQRLPRRLEEKRKQIREEIDVRREKARARKGRALLRW